MLWLTRNSENIEREEGRVLDLSLFCVSSIKLQVPDKCKHCEFCSVLWYSVECFRKDLICGCCSVDCFP